MIDDDYGSLVPGSKRSKHQAILDELERIDADDEMVEVIKPDSSTFLPSSFLKPKKKKEEVYQSEDDWFNDLMESTDIKIKRSKRKTKEIFEGQLESTQKKKKKNKGKTEFTDYEKKFETESAMLKNLLIDQNRFVNSLQKQYDFLSNSKSTSRGVTKNITDLINAITSARSLSLQITDKHIGLKKAISDLSMKEKKELGLIDTENMADFASTYMRQMLTERQQLLSGMTGDDTIGDYSENEIESMISDNLIGEERPDEVDKYLQYENRNVEIFAVINRNDHDDYHYEAYSDNGEGEEIPDYPLPNTGTKLSINTSTNVATDIFGQRYRIKWE